MSDKKKKEVFFTGLMLLQCPDCGNVYSVYSSDFYKYGHCKHCNTTFPLVDARQVIATCECGNKVYGVTNSKDKLLQFNCRCGYPLTAEYSHRKNKYYGLR